MTTNWVAGIKKTSSALMLGLARYHRPAMFTWRAIRCLNVALSIFQSCSEKPVLQRMQLGLMRWYPRRDEELAGMARGLCCPVYLVSSCPRLGLCARSLPGWRWLSLLAPSLSALVPPFSQKHRVRAWLPVWLQWVLPSWIFGRWRRSCPSRQSSLRRMQ